MAETSQQLISAEKLCVLTGLTDRRHRQLAKEGFFPAPVESQYVLTATIQGLFKYYRERNQNTNSALFTEKLARETADRKLAELELDKQTEALIPKTYVKRVWSHCIHATRARLLQMPDKFALAWATWQSSADCKKATDEEIRDALQEMKDNPDYFSGINEMADADEKANG